MVTINVVWKHISNTVANKVNDPFEELFASVIPIDRDGNFLDLVNSDCEEYEGDSYVMLRKLLRKTDMFPTGGFVYFCPAKITVAETQDEALSIRARALVGDDPRRKVLMIALVHPISADPETGLPADVVMENGIYWLDTNEFEVFPSTVNGQRDGKEEQGSLPLALGALALKCAIDNGTLGEIGVRLNSALTLAEKSLSEAESIFESLRDN